MKKLTLHLDDLQVETFATESDAGLTSVVGYGDERVPHTTREPMICFCSMYMTGCDHTCAEYHPNCPVG